VIIWSEAVIVENCSLQNWHLRIQKKNRVEVMPKAGDIIWSCFFDVLCGSQFSIPGHHCAPDIDALGQWCSKAWKSAGEMKEGEPPQCFSMEKTLN
jgi:hypothetical protein